MKTAYKIRYIVLRKEKDMRKNLLSTIVVFAALALTACGAKVEPCKKHTWVQDTSKQNVEATCSREGTKYEKCSVCGETRETPISKKAHTMGEWAPKAGEACGTTAHEEQVCSVCGAKEERVNGLVQHNWEEQNPATPAGDSGYKLVKCSLCQAEGLMIAAKDATVTGSKKSGTPTDCVKLGSDGNSFSSTISINAAKTGTFYMRGTMDYWYDGNNNNETKTYYSENNDHTDASTKTGNFKLEVGPSVDALTAIELPDDTSMTYGDMLPKQVGFTTTSTNSQGQSVQVPWSIIGDCIVGNGSLAAGTNIVKFTRVDSYNMAVHDILFVFAQ